MPVRTQLVADNQPVETPLERLERALIEAREAVMREQAALIDDLGAEIQRFRTVIHLDKDGVAFFDDDCKLVVANNRYREIYGLGPDATLPGAAAPDEIQRLFGEGGGGGDPCPSQGQATCAWTQRQLGESGGDPCSSLGQAPCVRQRTVDFPDGRFVEVRLAPTPSGGWASTHRDVTAVHERSALAAERLSLQNLIDLVPDNLWVKDAESYFVIANDATARRMGYASSADLIGKTDLELCPPETAQKYFADERRVVETGEPMIDCEEYVIAPDGGKCWISTTKVPLRDEGGDIIGLVGISRDMTARRLAAERLSLKKLIDLVPDNLWVKDADSRFLVANDATARQIGLSSSEDLIGKTDRELHPPEAAETYFADERRVVETGEPMIDFEEIVIAPDGRKVWLSSTKVPFRGEGGEVVGLFGISRDITARKLAERLRDGQARILEMIATNAPLADVLDQLARLIEAQLPGVRSSVLLLDEDGVHLRHGAAPSLPEAYVKSHDGLEIGPNVGSCGAAAYNRETVIVADVTTDPRWTNYRDAAAALAIRSSWSAPILSHQGQALGTFALYSDRVREPTEGEMRLIDVATKIAGIAIERKLAEDRIQFMATHDALTGLPNRALLRDRLTQALLLAERYDRWATVAFIDLDNFKYVNDSLGHNAGDDLLRTVAKRMVACVRPTDTVVRLGGDEFVIVLSDQAKSVEAISKTLKRLQKAITETAHVGGHGLRVTCSVGVANFPDDGRDAETLLANADAAMYRAKESGRDTIQFYRPEFNLRVQEKFGMQEALRCAVLRNEFVLFYQPQVNLRTGAILAVEALIRWRHPTLGLLPPSRFIPLAEESGLITAIGEWALNEACRQAKAWQDAGLPSIRMSVNVSARQFSEPRLTALVAAALADSGLDPKLLELEVTESMIMRDADQAVATMEELERLGVQLSIDDFGTGYSSLAALKTFPVARLKIDKAFIKGLPEDENDRAVATAVISLGQTLNLKVIAEGVETPEQADFLRRSNCDEMQGYHLSKPISPDEFATFLWDWNRRAEGSAA